MIRKLGFVMDPIAEIDIKKDSSFAMLLEARARGWEIGYMELNDLYLRDGQTFARMRSLTVERNPADWYRFGVERDESLNYLDVILMRKDPPCDQEYIYATYLLEMAEASGVLVVNKPQSLRDANEKLYTAWFPDCCAPTLVAREASRFKQFLHEQGEMVLKPLDGMGGRSIFHVRQGDPNLNVILETMTHHGKRFIMAQRYLPEIRLGDKRILLVDGKAVPFALARIPAPGESRGNLAAGARAEGRPLSERDHWLAARIGPVVQKKGLIFVGLDVIGDYVTEINVTSPTCIQELDRQFGLNIAGQLLDCIESHLSSGV
ncbi:MAG: glutathione synthase [Methylococcales bacterium]